MGKCCLRHLQSRPSYCLEDLVGLDFVVFNRYAAPAPDGIIH